MLDPETKKNGFLDNNRPKPAISTNIRFGLASVTSIDGSHINLPTVMRVKPGTGTNQITVVTLKRQHKVGGGSIVGPGLCALWTTDPFSIIGRSRTGVNWDKSHIVNFNHPY